MSQANLFDAITVPLYYESRLQQWQLDSESWSDDLIALYEDADLNSDAEDQLESRFAAQYEWLTSLERLGAVANDMVAHFVQSGFKGKAMYIGVDTRSVVRMYSYVMDAWTKYFAALRSQLTNDPDNSWLPRHIAEMEWTTMAVVVPLGKNEDKVRLNPGWLVYDHKRRLLEEDLAGEFASPTHRLRQVFVCGMLRTGFDAPNLTTIYLDRPMRGQTLIQTINLANHVFPGKTSGLIVDYVGAFRDPDKALPIADVATLADELAGAIATINQLGYRYGVGMEALYDATGSERTYPVESACESLLVSEQVRTDYLRGAATVRRLFKALLPHPAALQQLPTAAVISELADLIMGLRPPPLNSEARQETVQQMFDRYTGWDHYHSDQQGVLPRDNVVFVKEIEFDKIVAAFGNNQRSAADHLAWMLRGRAIELTRRNPARQEFIERTAGLTVRYKAGSMDVDEYLCQLRELNETLMAEEHRGLVEQLTDEELAIFDLLARPGPTLTDAERLVVKQSARHLIVSVCDKLGQDWRRQAGAVAEVREAVLERLGAELPAGPYPQPLLDEKVDAIINHLVAAYGNDGVSTYKRTRYKGVYYSVVEKRLSFMPYN